MSAARGLSRISPRVYWLPPGKPDRPSLCAVVGEHGTLMLDGGASSAHARAFLDQLAAEGVAPPTATALTHSDWDHVFGAAEVNAPVVAHRLTAEDLVALAGTDWSDEALDARVAAGARTPQHARNLKEELPSPRDVRIALADITFEDALDLDLGGVDVHVEHVGGDHAPDSSVVYVEQDRVLFLGDSLYASTSGPERTLTTKLAFPLLDTVLSFDAELFVEGHTDSVMSRTELVTLLDDFRHAGTLVDECASNSGAVDETSALVRAAQQLGGPPSDQLRDLIREFIAGHLASA
jgi:glyoxylase-like metal-dependent hydrolase (beta-lactamase superfamily II)